MVNKYVPGPSVPVAQAYFELFNADGLFGFASTYCGELQHDIRRHAETSVIGINWFTASSVIKVFVGAPDGGRASVVLVVSLHEIAPYVHDARAWPPVQ